MCIRDRPGGGEAGGLLALLNVSAVLGCCYLALYPTYDLLNYFKGRQRLLERSAGLTLRQVLPAKLAVNLALIMLSLILAWIGSGLIGRFNTEHLSYFRLRGENISWPFLLFFSAGLPILWTFLNLVLSRRLPDVYKRQPLKVSPHSSPANPSSIPYCKKAKRTW